MSFPRYPKYKASGVEWLGEIPQAWTVKSLRRFSCVVQTGPFGSQLHADEYITGGTPVINPVNMVNGQIVPNEEITVTDEVLDRLPHQRLHVGDVVFSRRGELGRCALVTDAEKGWLCGTGSMILRLHHSEYHAGYLSHYLSLGLLRQYFESFSIGSIMDSLSSETLLAMPMIVPPVEQQCVIAAFVTSESSKIDGLVGEQRRLIELLKEKRQAVISHAVTKGLNPHAPLKPSGIEWLGDVPEHWEVNRLKRLIQYSRGITYGIVQPGESDPTGRFMIRGKDYSGGWCEADEIFRVSDAIEIPYTRSRMRENDLVMTIVGAGVGNVAMIPDWLDGSNITQTTARIAVDPLKAEPAYVCFALQGVIGQRNLERNVYGSAQPRLNIEHVDSYLMTVPPVAEQREIVAMLKTQLETLDALTAEAERGIELLQERRTALISAAVTGQIDVRGLVSS